MHMKIVAKALITDREGNTLVLVRSKTHPHFPLEADLPGGEVEASEAPQDAVAREIQEETGLLIVPTGHQLVTEQISPSGSLHQLYAATIEAIKPTVTLSWEHVSYEWVPHVDLLTKLHTQDNYMNIVTKHLAGH